MDAHNVLYSQFFDDEIIIRHDDLPSPTRPYAYGVQELVVGRSTRILYPGMVLNQTSEIQLSKGKAQISISRRPKATIKQYLPNSPLQAPVDKPNTYSTLYRMKEREKL